MVIWEIRDGYICQNGRRILPLGIYYNSFETIDKLKRKEDVVKIASLGFRFIRTPIGRHDIDFLDLCKSLGMFVVLQNDDPDPKYLSSLVKNHEAFAWRGSFDDVDQGNYSPRLVEDANLVWTELESNVLTYISGGSSSKLYPYIGTSDILASQKYPIPSEPPGSIHRSYTALKRAYDGNPDVAKRVALVANLQAFGWHGTERYPTPQELTLHAYTALIAGMRGVLWYTYFDSQNYLPNHPELLEAFRTLIPKLRGFESYMMSGKYTAITTGTNDVFASHWTTGRRTLVLAANCRSDHFSGLINANPNATVATGVSWQQTMFRVEIPALSVKDWIF